MTNAIVKVPSPVNEPVKSYAPGSSERAAVKAQLTELLGETPHIPLIIGGEEIVTEAKATTICPHDHGHVLATVSQAGAEHVEQAIAAARAAWQGWSETPWEARAAVFLKAAELLAGPWRAKINAATMLNQSKTVYQAEIDASCELIDFWRFNVDYMRQIYTDQPSSAPGIWNRVEYRALEGFVFAIAPFNFTSISGNLASAPALMGNTVLWKPGPTSMLSSYLLMRLMEEAGLPKGVINFIPGDAPTIGDAALASPELAGIHFTGSTNTFQHLWRKVGENIAGYNAYPRLVGETGGKDFVFAHPSADAPSVATALVRGAFEFQGQKCSAASRAYVAESLWPAVRDGMKAQLAEITVGDPLDFRHFMAAVIDERSFDKIQGYLDEAKGSESCEVVHGGGADKSVGYFVEPTVVVTTEPDHRLMREEIFGPVLTVYVYPDEELEETLSHCSTSSPYALTGAIFARDRGDIVMMSDALKHAAGNFYINDKPTGAVVGQQPFGGGRASGTNDKAGSAQNLLRWTSVRTIKECFVPATAHGYPHQDEA
jgi:1-pyrroline-5-carboxylate dehydrogenase